MSNNNNPCEDCTTCNRDGLLILPVRPSVVESKIHGPLVPKLSKALGGEFASLDWKGHTPVARILRPGYVHVYYEKSKEWDFYQVTPNGFFKRASHTELSEKNAPAPDFQCKNAGVNVLMSTIGIRDAKNQTKVWIAFADHLWSGPTLQHYAGNADDRALRMSLVEPSAWINSGTAPKRSLVLNSANLEAVIPEYADAALAKNKGYATIFASSTQPFETVRLNNAKPYAERARAIEKSVTHTDLNEKTLILLLDDPVGVAESLQHSSLMIERNQDIWNGGGVQVNGLGADKERPWKRQSVVMVKTLEEWVKQSRRAEEVQRLTTGMMCTKDNFMLSRPNVKGQRWVGNIMKDAKGVPIKVKPGTVQKGIMLDADGKDISHLLTDGYQRSFKDGHRVYDQPTAEKLAVEHTKTTIQNRVARYRKKLRYDKENFKDGLVAFDENYQAQEKAWLVHRKAADQDIVMWLRGKRFGLVMTQDYERQSASIKALRAEYDKKKKEGKKDEAKAQIKEIKNFLRDAIARIAATDRALGAGPLGADTLKYFAEQLKLPVNDSRNLIARGLLKPFDLQDELAGKGGPASELYDGVTGIIAFGKTDLPDVWTLIGQQTADMTGRLINAQTSAISRLAELTYDPSQARLLGITLSTAEVDNMRILWVRGNALLNLGYGGQRQYALRLKTTSHEVAASLAQYGLAYGTDRLVTIKSTDANTSTRRQVTTAPVDNRMQLLRQQIASNPNVDIVVPVLIDESAWQRFMSGVDGPTTQVMSDNVIGGPKGMVHVPTAMVDDLLAMHANAGWRALGNARNLGATLGLKGTFIMQAWATYESVKALWNGTSSNTDLADQSLSTLGGIASFVAVGMEVRAMITEPALGQGRNTAMRQLIHPARMRLGAGLAGSVAGMFDAVISFVKFQDRKRNGDRDASSAYFWAGSAYGLSSVVSGVGAYLSYSAIAGRAAQVASVRLITGVMVEVGAAAIWGASLTGVGLLLAVVGLGLTLWAISMEDDDNEIFLDRTYFGLHGNQTTHLPFKDLDQEVKAFGALALGLRVELGWDDNFGPDVVNVKMLVAGWNEKSRLVLTMTAMPAPQDKQLSSQVLAYGEVSHQGYRTMAAGLAKPDPQLSVNVAPSKDNGNAHEITISAKIINEVLHRRVKFEFSYWDDAKAYEAKKAPKVKDTLIVID